MEPFSFEPASPAHIPFIAAAYEANLEALHGAHRTPETWAELLNAPGQRYFIVTSGSPVAWFRLDEDDSDPATGWVGMVQVHPDFHRRGVGRYILTAAEALLRSEGRHKIGLHTTEDNLPARSLYLSQGYTVTEVGPCTTADGAQRVGYTFLKDL